MTKFGKESPRRVNAVTTTHDFETVSVLIAIRSKLTEFDLLGGGGYGVTHPGQAMNCDLCCFFVCAFEVITMSSKCYIY